MKFVHLVGFIVTIVHPCDLGVACCGKKQSLVFLVMTITQCVGENVITL